MSTDSFPSPIPSRAVCSSFVGRLRRLRADAWRVVGCLPPELEKKASEETEWLDTQEQVMSARVSIGHHRNRSTRQYATGHPQPADPAMGTPLKRSALPCPAAPIPGRGGPEP